MAGSILNPSHRREVSQGGNRLFAYLWALAFSINKVSDLLKIIQWLFGFSG